MTRSSTELALLSHDTDNEISPSIYQIDSIHGVKTTLEVLKKQEREVTARLEALLATQKDLSGDLGRLDLLRAHLGSHAVSTRAISHGILFEATSTAKRISAAVKKLDLEQARVKSTLDVVEQVAELKACVLGVTGSMGAPQDWEAAAGYLNRASNIPTDIVGGAFAEEIVPTAEVPDPPKVTLEHASASLQGLFLREFEKAAQEGNGAKITRFFKLFPLIGKSDVGLEVYGRYVCQGVAARARSNLSTGTEGAHRREGFFYANSLTKLFEHIAQIVEHHSALVERHYGAGRMIKVIERLQLEADVQGGIILDTWSDERDVDRILTDIKSYAFTFLVKSFLPSQPARTGTPRAGSPAHKVPTANDLNHEDENINMKDVDGHLGEIALMLGRWALYSRFISSKCKVFAVSTRLSTNNQHGQESTHALENGASTLRAPALLTSSTLNSKISDKLITPFSVMTTFFFRRSVEKAFQLDEQPADLSLNPAKVLASNPPYITSTVDDVMYIVNQVIERSLATSQRAVVSSVIPTLARVLSSDFIGMIQRKMRDESYPKAAVQGAIPPEQTIIAFFVLIINLDVATNYLKRIVMSRLGGAASGSLNDETNLTTMTMDMESMFPFENDSAFVLSSLNSLQQSFDTKATELINDGIFVAFKNVVKPRLRPILADTFRDIDYQINVDDHEVLSQEIFAEDEDQDNKNVAIQHRFQRGWDALTMPVARIMTERNFERLLTTIIAYLGEVLEKRIWSYYGRVNTSGAARLERDIASIVNVAIRGGRYSLREAFTRCMQICLIMNMEDDEWDELQAAPVAMQNGNALIDWKLDVEERLRARAMMHSVEGRLIL